MDLLKAAVDVRVEFVFVNGKLMDELEKCYHVHPQPDMNNIIDHRPNGDKTWILENDKTVTPFCLKLDADSHLKDIRDKFSYPKKKGIKDRSSKLTKDSNKKTLQDVAKHRMQNQTQQANNQR